MNVLKISTLNTRGGGNKINEIISTIDKCGDDVICFQEMNEISEIKKRIIERKCEGAMYINNGSSQSRGVAIFIRNKENIIKKGVSKKDSCGRMIAVEIGHAGKSRVIFNLYAPNDIKQRHDFFVNVHKESENCNGIIVYAGDFNCVLDKEMDRTNSDSSGANKSDRSRDALRRMIENSTVDVYRRLNPMGSSYTFTGSNEYRARLNRIYLDTETAESRRIQLV